MKVAVFENKRIASSPEIDQIVQKALKESWTPFVHVISRKEKVVIFARFSKKHAHMLVVAAEPGEVVLAQMKLSKKAFKEWYSDTKNKARKIL